MAEFLSSCRNIDGEQMKENDVLYPCFTESLETPFCKCKKADEANGDMELINTRMMCREVRRYIGDIWFDPITCQVKRCSESEMVDVMAVGCRRESTDKDNPDAYCVKEGDSGFPCVYEGQYYSYCVCEKYDDKHGVAKPIMCGSHLAGTEYISDCNNVKCTTSGLEIIMKQNCKDSSGNCITNTTDIFPCFYNGLYRGACICDDGCNMPTEKPSTYRVVIEFSRRIPKGEVYVSLCGDQNESPIQRLTTNLARTFSAETFDTQYVGTPLRLIFQLIGPPEKNENGGKIKYIKVFDFSTQKAYNFNPIGVNSHTNEQTWYPETWVNTQTWKFLESLCMNEECKDKQIYSHKEKYKVMFYCPYATGKVKPDGQFAFIGEHLYTELQYFTNDKFIEESHTGPGRHPVFRGEYTFSYTGKIAAMLMMMNSTWQGQCTFRVKIPKRKMEFEFRYDPKKVDYRKIIIMDCISSANCGQRDWDLVCDNTEMADWCKKDQCCSRKKLACGRLCYVPDQEYIGKWKDENCQDYCRTSENKQGPPNCLSMQGNRIDCQSVPRCSYLNCTNGRCYALLDKVEIRSAAKDNCFDNFAGRLMMPNDKNFFHHRRLSGIEAKLGYSHGFWIDGLHDFRSPVIWKKVRHSMPKYLSEPFDAVDDYLTVRDGGPLDMCPWAYASRVFATNCIRAGKPLCETKWGT